MKSTKKKLLCGGFALILLVGILTPVGPFLLGVGVISLPAYFSVRIFLPMWRKSTGFEAITSLPRSEEHSLRTDPVPNEAATHSTVDRQVRLPVKKLAFICILHCGILVWDVVMVFQDPAWLQFLGPSIFTIVTASAGWFSSHLLRPVLAGRQPCKLWFTVTIGTAASVLTFEACYLTVFLFSFGEGRVDFVVLVLGGIGLMFAGLFWGGLFSFFIARMIWRGFDNPNRDYELEKNQLMRTDLKLLLSSLRDRLKRFRPDPGFANTGFLPWSLFFTSVGLSVLFSLLFCLLTILTEGGPGVDPVWPVSQ